MWRGDRQTELQPIVLLPEVCVCVLHLVRFLWLRLRLWQTRWGAGCQKAPRHPRILPVVERMLVGPGMATDQSAKRMGAQGRGARKRNRNANNTAISMSQELRASRLLLEWFSGCRGVWECWFIGFLRIQCPHSGLFNRYFLRGKNLNVSVAAVARQPPAGRLLRLSRRSRSAQESTECRLSQCVP
jgi:hypothetical protein